MMEVVGGQPKKGGGTRAFRWRGTMYVGAAVAAVFAGSDLHTALSVVGNEDDELLQLDE